MNLGVMLAASMGLAAHIPRPPEPIGNPGEWITTQDYPSAALRQEVEGVTGVALDIGATGRVERCSVESSSGSTLLDETTCTLLSRRGSYRPATDEHGHAISAVITQRIRWQLPGDPKPPVDFKPYNLVVRFEISETGTIENCAVISKPTDMPMGDPCVAGAATRFNPILDKDGRPIRQKILWRMSMQPQ